MDIKLENRKSKSELVTKLTKLNWKSDMAHRSHGRLETSIAKLEYQASSVAAPRFSICVYCLKYNPEGGTYWAPVYLDQSESWDLSAFVSRFLIAKLRENRKELEKDLEEELEQDLEEDLEALQNPDEE